MKVSVKPSKVVTLQGTRANPPALPKEPGHKPAKKNALQALFGRKRPRPSVNSVPTRTPAL